MAKHQISKTLERAYRSTTFVVDHSDGPLVIRIGETSEQLDALLRQHKARRWAYVTACNPRSAQISSVVNSQRHSELKAYLLSMGFTIYPGRGVPAEPGWEPEDSFLVLDITREQAVRVGVMLEQNAIVLGEAGKPASLVFCELPEASKERYADEVTADIRCYIDEHIEELWENAWVLGIWVRESDVPDKVNAEDLDILEGKIPSRRRAALEAGKEPTPRELRLWREAWVERALRDDGDCDVVPGYAISKVFVRSEAIYALILATGYSFTDIEHWLEGIFPSVEAATAHIAADGWHTE